MIFLKFRYKTINYREPKRKTVFLMVGGKVSPTAWLAAKTVIF